MALSIRLQDQLPDLWGPVQNRMWGPLFKNYKFKKGNRALNTCRALQGRGLVTAQVTALLRVRRGPPCCPHLLYSRV